MGEYRLRLSAQADRDLREIVEFIARDNPAAAERVGLALLERTEVLKSGPTLGRKVRGTRDDRVLVEGSILPQSCCNFRIEAKMYKGPPFQRLSRPLRGGMPVGQGRAALRRRRQQAGKRPHLAWIAHKSFRPTSFPSARCSIFSGAYGFGGGREMFL